MRKAIERFVYVTVCCCVLGILPLHAAQAADPTAPKTESVDIVDVQIASHFTPEVSAPAATISIAPIDPLRPVHGFCGGLGGGCLDAGSVPTVIIEDPPIFECGGLPCL